MRTAAVRSERMELTIRMITKLFSFTLEERNITTLEVKNTTAASSPPNHDPLLWNVKSALSIKIT